MPTALQRPNPMGLGRSLANIVAGDQPPMDLGDFTPGRRNPLTGQVNPMLPAPRLRERSPPNPDTIRSGGGILSAAVAPLNPATPAMDAASSADMPPVNMPGGNDPTPLPGPVSGYGGGTFNMDGSQATPVNRVGDGPRGAERADYAAMLQNAVGPAPKMNTGQRIASIVGPMLMAASGNQAGATQMIQAMQGRKDDYARRQQNAAMTAIQWQRDDDQEAAKRNAPQFFSGNEDRVRFDPTTGRSQRVYDAPQDFEDYAAAAGHAPGSPEYFRAAEDYVLRGNGPTASGFDRDLELLRTLGRYQLEDKRQQNRAALRGQPTYRDLNPPPPRAAAPRRDALPVVSSPADALKLPSGTRFKTPDGKVKVRP